MPIPLDNPDLRDALGLPSRPLSRPRWHLLVAAGAGVLAAAAALGYLAGTLRMDYRRTQFARGHAGLVREYDPTRVRDGLGRLEAQRAALVDDPRMRMAMASVYIHAAQVLPHQRHFLEQAWGELQAAAARLRDKTNAVTSRHVADLESHVLMELGRDQEARERFHTMTRLAEANKWDLQRRVQIMFDNNLSYLLASAKDPSVRDPAQALRLAKGVIGCTAMIEKETPAGEGTTYRLPSEVPSLLDTLAEAYHAAGDSRQALRIQRAALAMARSRGLDVYLKHFDKYERAAKR